MKKLILLAPLLLCACEPDRQVVVSTPKVPERPSEFQKAEPLPPNTDQTMGGQVLDNTSNIKAYNNLRLRYNSMLDLYDCVKVMINEGKTCQTQKTP